MALLEIDDLRKHYPTGEKALRGVDLVVEKREIVALLGLSGSGKSTLLRCINRLVDPDSGRVVLDGVEITGLGKYDLRRARVHMGMIFQEFNLVDRLTVLENVLSGTLGVTPLWRVVTRAFHAGDIRRAIELCSRVGIADHIRKRADQLSGGQRQRVGIARALMQHPKLLLVDEPTSSLDPKIGAEVMEVKPAWDGIVIYNWDSRLRSSTILGFVGAGGIGLHLREQISLLEYHAAMGIIAIIIVLVIISETISHVLRERLR